MPIFLMKIRLKYLILEIPSIKDDGRKVREHRRKRKESDARKDQLVGNVI